MTVEASDREVIGAMLDGGLKLAEYALAQWEGDKYKLGAEIRDANIRRWHYIETRMREIAKEWKATAK